jgi:hypothetical protein
VKVLSPPCWLAGSDLGPLRVGPSGVLIGRSPDCDMVLPDPRTSRHHALVREAMAGPILIPLGRNPTLVNGVRASQVMPLQRGDQLSFPGLQLEVILNDVSRPAGRSWVMLQERGTVMATIRRTLILGSGSTDDLLVPSWPAAALRLDQVGRSLIATFHSPGTIDGAEHPAETVIQLTSGSLLACGEERIRVAAQRDHSQATVLQVKEGLGEPADHFRFLGQTPKGGKLSLSFDGREVQVTLSELRARLFESLLRAGGEPLDDSTLIPLVFPPPQRRTVRDLDLLIHRLRTVLIGEGLDPYRFIERDLSQTRLRVGEHTQLSIEES